MITPLAIRTIRTASRRTTSTWRGSRSQRAAKATASGRGSTVVRSTTAPSALRDDLLGDDEDVVGSQREDPGRSLRSRRRGARGGRRRAGSPRCPRGPGRRAARSPAERVRHVHARWRGRVSPGRRPRAGRPACRGRARGHRRARGRSPRPRRRPRRGPPGCPARSGTGSPPAAQRGARSCPSPPGPAPARRGAGRARPSAAARPASRMADIGGGVDPGQVGGQDEERGRRDRAAPGTSLLEGFVQAGRRLPEGGGTGRRGHVEGGLVRADHRHEGDAGRLRPPPRSSGAGAAP